MGWAIKNRHLFLTILEGGESKIKVSADPVSGEILFLVSARLLVHRQQSLRRPLGSLIRGLVPFMRAPSPKNHLLRIQPPNTITLGLRFQPMIFGASSQSMVEY